jgi:membrane protease YdiL (CAAX protease family)
MNKESVPSLLLSPFKWRYLKSPWVYVPLVVGGAVGFLGGNNKSLSKAERVTMFGHRYTPAKSAVVLQGVQTYRYLMVGAGEELYFRGILQTELTELTNPKVGLIVSSLLFGLWHIPNNGAGSGLGASLGGAYFGYVYKRNGFDIGSPVALHFWGDFLGMLIEYIRNPQDGHFVYSISWRL